MGEEPLVVHEQQGGISRVVVMTERLTTDDRPVFIQAFKEAIEASSSTVELDLTQTGFLYSLFVGVILDGVKKAQDADKSVEIIARDSLIHMLRELGIDKAATLRTAGA